MPKSSRRSIFALVGASALALTLSGVPVIGAESGPIRIGLLLSYKGVYAPTSEGADRGFQVALAEFGNSIGGRKIELVREDDELSPSVAVQKFNRLVLSEKVDVVAGVISSSVAIALSEIAQKVKKPLIFSFAFADEVTGKFCNPYVARTSFSANAFQYGAGAYWARKGVKTAVTLGPDYSAGRSFLEAFKRGFEDNGGKVVNQIWTPFQKTKDWGAALTSAKASGAEIIYSFYSGNEAVQVVRQHAEFGLKKTMPLIGDQWVYDETLWPAMGDAVLGARHITVHYPGIDTPENRAFVEAYRKMFNADPDVNAALGYDNAKAILLTLQKFGGTVPKDGAEFVAALRQIQFEAPRGLVRFAPTGSAQLASVYVVEIERGSDGKLFRKYVDQFPGAGDLPGCERAF